MGIDSNKRNVTWYYCGCGGKWGDVIGVMVETLVVRDWVSFTISDESGVIVVETPFIGASRLNRAQSFAQLRELEDEPDIHLPDLCKFGITWRKFCRWKFVVMVLAMVDV